MVPSSHVLARTLFLMHFLFSPEVAGAMVNLPIQISRVYSIFTLLGLLPAVLCPADKVLPDSDLDLYKK